MSLRKVEFFIVVTAIIGLFAFISSSRALDLLRYMDKAGNIHFVDNISKVPKEYREQIIKPTPVPELSKDQIRELQRKQRLEEEERKRKEHDREVEKKRKKEEYDDRRRKAEQNQKRNDDANLLERRD